MVDNRENKCFPTKFVRGGNRVFSGLVRGEIAKQGRKVLKEFFFLPYLY